MPHRSPPLMFGVALLQLLLEGRIRVCPKSGKILGYLYWPLIGSEDFHHQRLSAHGNSGSLGQIKEILNAG